MNLVTIWFLITDVIKQSENQSDHLKQWWNFYSQQVYIDSNEYAGLTHFRLVKPVICLPVQSMG